MKLNGAENTAKTIVVVVLGKERLAFEIETVVDDGDEFVADAFSRIEFKFHAGVRKILKSNELAIPEKSSPHAETARFQQHAHIGGRCDECTVEGGAAFACVLRHRVENAWYRKSICVSDFR